MYTIGRNTFNEAGNAYDYLVASPSKKDKDRLSGSQIAKVKTKSAEASSTLEVASKDGMTYEADHLIDGDMKTTWCEGDKGLGISENITIKLDGGHEIASLKIYNGFLKDKRRYTINGKASKLEIDYGNGYTQVVTLGIMDIDDADEELFSLEEMNPTEVTAPANCVTDTIKITILDAEAGSQYKDVGISEVEIFGR